MTAFHSTTPRPPRRATAFTLTEVMIALAMTAFLLIGISRIFALTATTIGAGQALSTAMRGQKAIGTTLSADIVGVGSDLTQSGMLPMVNTLDSTYVTPYLSINNYRVATYQNAEDYASDVIGVTDATSITAAQFRSRSLAIRGVDLDKNGAENPTAMISGGETIPLFSYGTRNFRCDTLSFFSRGNFRSQTGSGANFVNAATSNEAFVWYGHLRIYNGEPDRLDYANAYGCPGDWLTPSSPVKPNRNQRFADQFRLGRMQSLLIEPTQVQGGAVIESTQGTTSMTTTAGNDNGNAIAGQGVLIDRDPTQPVAFVQRNWWSPRFKPTTGSPITRPSMTPLALSSSVRIWNLSANRAVYTDDRYSGGTPAPSSTAFTLTAFSSRTDVIGASLRTFRQRAEFTQHNDYDSPPAATQAYWWEDLPLGWANRYFANPFPRVSQTDTSGTTLPLNAKSMSQRQQLLADSCSQFIVEYAGDFVTQNADGTVPAGGAHPDGVVDFAVVGGVRQTRFYGMPRDVDGDGHIYTSSTVVTSAPSSPDVIPLGDFANSRQTPTLARGASNVGYTEDSYLTALAPSTYIFERSFPSQTTPVDYGVIVDEPTKQYDGSNAAGTPADTAYECLWGPREMQKFGATSYYAVPQLIRIIADVRDPSGKLKEPLTQEYVFPVRVTGAIAGTP